MDRISVIVQVGEIIKRCVVKIKGLEIGCPYHVLLYLKIVGEVMVFRPGIVNYWLVEA